VEPANFQSISGTKSVEIYPYIRKIDLTSSNSYILSSRDQIVLIDPGGLEDQTLHLAEAIEKLQVESERPVVTYLTHAHLDHCIQLEEYGKYKAFRNSVLAVHEAGALALENQDSRVTLADILGKQMERISPEVKLFSEEDGGQEGRVQVDLDQMTFSYARHSVETDGGYKVQSLAVPLGDGDEMEIYHIPGHSPDSICINVGDLLMVGDIFFAPNPGMAGTSSWNRDDLLESISKVLWIIENKGITTCLSGHGRTVDSESAKRTLVKMYDEAESLKNIAQIDLDWTRQTGSFAKETMSELERLFTIVGGRLAYVSHVLDELEEEAEAKGTDSLLKASFVDDIFSDFNRFTKEIHSGKKVEIELIHKAGQIMGKLERAMCQDELGLLIDRSMMRRVSRMLNDYSTMYRGFRPPSYVSDIDINRQIEEILENLAHKPYDEEAILEAESTEEYLKALKARIAHIDIFEDVELKFFKGRDLPLIRTDRERLSDALVDVLERMVGTGANGINIKSSADGDWVAVRISDRGGDCCNPVADRSLRFFENTFALCGGFMQTHVLDGERVVEIEFVSSNVV
jgi:glyoxylase-like metal-dependent hydrolase (beta-lactamase superfamily II)